MRQKEEAKLSLEKLLKGCTINAVIQLRMDDIAGSIEVGKSTNYNVYGVNLFDVPYVKILKVNRLPERMIYNITVSSITGLT